MKKRKILVTGAAGYIFSLLLPAFQEKYELTLLDVKDTDPRGNKIQNIKISHLAGPDFEQDREYFQGVDTVIHLGYFRQLGGREDNLQKRGYPDERTNVDMAYHTYKLSHDAGVRRLVVASSNHATDWYEYPIHHGMMDTITPEILPLSDNFYGWAKIAYEQIGFIFASGYFGRKLEMVFLRIGHPREVNYQRFNNDLNKYKRYLGAYISKRDLQQLFIKSIETENINNAYDIPFQIFYGVSDNARRFWSIANARKVIGYEPVDDSEIKYSEPGASEGG